MEPWAAWGELATGHTGQQVGPGWPVKGMVTGPEVGLSLSDGDREPLTAAGYAPSTQGAGEAWWCCPGTP